MIGARWLTDGVGGFLFGDFVLRTRFWINPPLRWYLWWHRAIKKHPVDNTKNNLVSNFAELVMLNTDRICKSIEPSPILF
jgi:hypothetical protein